jgi:hypothetical protein
VTVALPEFAEQWMAQWRSAGPALAEQRARELRGLTDERARAATAALLDLAAAVPIPAARWGWSGLVVQQALFHGKLPPQPE